MRKTNKKNRSVAYWTVLLGLDNERLDSFMLRQSDIDFVLTNYVICKDQHSRYYLPTSLTDNYSKFCPFKFIIKEIHYNEPLLMLDYCSGECFKLASSYISELIYNSCL